MIYEQLAITKLCCIELNSDPTATACLFACSVSQETGAVLLAGLRKLIPTITTAHSLTLDFNLTEDLKSPISLSIGQFLSSLS